MSGLIFSVVVRLLTAPRLRRSFSYSLQMELVQYALVWPQLAPPYLGITKGFLPVIFEAMEKAPLFDPSATTPPKGDLAAYNGALLRRLPFFYNVNHLFYYEKVCGLLWRSRARWGLLRRSVCLFV